MRDDGDNGRDGNGNGTVMNGGIAGLSFSLVEGALGTCLGSFRDGNVRR